MGQVTDSSLTLMRGTGSKLTSVLLKPCDLGIKIKVIFLIYWGLSLREREREIGPDK